VVQATHHPQFTNAASYAPGVKTENVIQHVDKLLLERITDKLTAKDYDDARLAQLKRLETMLNEAGETGLGKQITAFFSAWQDVSNNPESSAVRQVLKETSQNLATRFQTLMRDVQQVKRDLDTYMDGAVTEINSICTRIADLNAQIMLDESADKTANDLRDERTRQLNDLSKLVNIKWFETGGGAVTVFAGEGKVIVQESYPKSGDTGPLSFQYINGSSQKQVVWRNMGIVMTHQELTGGRLGAWLEMRDSEVPLLENYLNDLSETMIWQVNSQHSQGVGLAKFSDVTGNYASPDASTDFDDANNTLPFADKVVDGSFDMWVYESGTRRKYTITVKASDDLTTLRDRINSTVNPSLITAENPVASIVDGDKMRLQSTGGIEFAFANDTSHVLAALGINTFFQGRSASSIAVNSVITADERMVAAGRLLTDGEHAVGDNKNALDIADLKDADTMTGSTETFNESVTSWAAKLGTKVAATNDSLKFSEVANNELQDLRDNVSAVNLDEEMVKMIKFQRSYQMAAKLVTTADTLLAALIELKR
jgi:flagellar hook-associated protein 1 FlgK